ncbi:MAG: type II toxin-antitoxin system PemK/MazF family toxin [Pyrinomonadaceae bacterium]
MVSRFDVYLVNLDADPSKDAKNTRPCVVISPNEMNHNVQNVIIAPLSSAGPKYPTRIPVTFLNSERAIILDQLRVVDSVRLVKKIGEIDKPVQKETLDRLQEMFAE